MLIPVASSVNDTILRGLMFSKYVFLFYFKKRSRNSITVLHVHGRVQGRHEDLLAWTAVRGRLGVVGRAQTRGRVRNRLRGQAIQILLYIVKYEYMAFHAWIEKSLW